MGSSGKLFYTNKIFYDLFALTPGLSKFFKKNITHRLELPNTVFVNLLPILEFRVFFHKEIIGFLNHYYSQVASVNNTVLEVKRLSIIRLYLIRSYKGRCHAIGKPVRGQRTWSNA